MKAVKAQFRPAWRPGRREAIALGLLALLAVAALAGASWQRARGAALALRLVELEDERRGGRLRPPPRPPQAYADSAAIVLRERGAAWAPMLRSLESAAVIGVTPTLVEFNAADGSARAEIAYADSAALLDYVGRLDEGLAPSDPFGRWSLVQLHAPPAANPVAVAGMTAPAGLSAATATATVQSNWAPRR